MAKVEVVMPQMGESVMEGTVIEWSKNVGDTVEVDETLLEIATDKVDSEVPSPEAGVLVQILVEEGDTIEVGNPIAIIETDADAAEPLASAPAVEEKTEEPAAVEESAPVEEVAEETASAPAESGNDSGDRIEVVMPQMGESVVEATVIEWSKSVGDTVEEDETLLEISTDKVDSEVPSPISGTLVEILAEADETIEVGQVIAIVSTGSGAASAKPANASKPKAPEAPEKPAASGMTKDDVARMTPEQLLTSSASPNGENAVSRTSSEGKFFSPLVRSIAKEEGVSMAELETIEGTGMEGRVTKNDILNFVKQRSSGATTVAPAKAPTAPKPAPAKEKDTISAGELNVTKSPTGDVEVIKMDRMRKLIAEHMVHSKQTSAHVTTFAEVDVTNMVNWRNANKVEFQKKTGIKLTFTPLFVEAIITAMLEFPMINSSVVGDEIHIKKDINFGIAVALGTGGEGGLIVPVIKKAQQKNVVGLAESVNEVAAKARSKKLSPDDLVGGTITLTNYGSVGNLMGTPIINQPQVAILGTGAIVKRPVVMETEAGDVIAIRHMMFLSMSYDHRIIDGAHGGAFVNRVKELLEGFDTERSL